MSADVSTEAVGMEVQINAPQRDHVTGDRGDGALADDERTEAERSPAAKSRRLVMTKPPDLLDTSGELESDMNAMDKPEPEEGIADGEITPGADLGSNHKGKRRNRRKGKGGKHHSKKWKPYTKLSWEERRIQDERESRRATQRREQRFASGQPMAPYNTTQFLMEQHGEEQEGNPEGGPQPPQPQTDRAKVTRTGPLHSISVSGEGSGSMESSEEYYSSPDDEEMFLQRDFSEEYDNFHAERLQGMSKDELVREYLELEGKIEKLEGKSSDKSEGSDLNTKEASPQSKTSDNVPSNKLQEELQRLRQENDLLKKENDILRAGMLNNVTFDNKENQPQS